MTTACFPSGCTNIEEDQTSGTPLWFADLTDFRNRKYFDAMGETTLSLSSLGHCMPKPLTMRTE